MKKPFRPILLLLMAALGGVYYYFLFKPDRYLFDTGFPCVLTVICSFLLFLLPGSFIKTKKIIRFVFALAAAYWIFHCATHLFSWPYDYYVTWIKLFKEGFRGGEINSLLFELAVFYMACVFSSSESGTRMRSWIFLAGIIPFGYAFLTGSLLAGLLSGALFAMGFFLPLLFGAEKKSSPVFRPLTGIFALLLGLSFLLSWVSWPDVSSNFRGTALHPFLQKIIRSIFTDIPYFADNYTQYASSGNAVEMYSYPARSSRPVASVTWKPGAVLYLRNTVSTGLDGNYRWLPPDRSTLANRETLSNVPSERISIQVLEDFTFMTLSRLDSEGVISSVPLLYNGTTDTGFRFLEPVRNGSVYSIVPGSKIETTPDAEYLTNTLDIASSAVVSEILDFLPFSSADNETFLQELSDYYSENFSYSLNPDVPQSGKNPLEHFFFTTRTGYCTQFATLTALLCRARGIPARFVSGFLIVFPVDRPDAPILSYNAHSWVEIYDADKGWVTLETTPIIMDLTQGRYEDYLRKILGLDNESRAQLSTVSQIAQPEQVESPKILQSRVRLGIVLAFLLIAGIVFYSFRHLVIRQDYPLTVLARSYLARLSAIRRKSLKPAESFDGWLYWLLKSETRKNLRDCGEIRNLLLRMLYTKYIPVKADKEAIDAYLENLRP